MAALAGGGRKARPFAGAKESDAGTAKPLTKSALEQFDCWPLSNALDTSLAARVALALINEMWS